MFGASPASPSPAVPPPTPPSASSSTSEPSPPAAPNPAQWANCRLAQPFPVRLLLVNTASFLTGSLLGAGVGGRKMALQFRAENAHRQPTSTKGWYFYHKTKNYKVMHAGIVEGVKTGARLSCWVTMFVVLEDAVDRLRGRVDMLATMAAGLSVAGVFSAWEQLGYGLTVRAAKKGLLVGVVYGGLQDVIRYAKGQSGGVGEYLGLGRRKEREARA